MTAGTRGTQRAPPSARSVPRALARPSDVPRLRGPCSVPGGDRRRVPGQEAGPRAAVEAQEGGVPPGRAPGHGSCVHARRPGWLRARPPHPAALAEAAAGPERGTCRGGGHLGHPGPAPPFGRGPAPAHASARRGRWPWAVRVERCRGSGPGAGVVAGSPTGAFRRPLGRECRGESGPPTAPCPVGSPRSALRPVVCSLIRPPLPRTCGLQSARTGSVRPPDARVAASPPVGPSGGHQG